MREVHPRDSNFSVALYFTFKIIPAIAGTISIYLGYRLFIMGVTGQASLSVESHSVKGQLLNAAPGLFFALGGIAILSLVVWKGVKLDFSKGADGEKEAYFHGPPESL